VEAERLYKEGQPPMSEETRLESAQLAMRKMEKHRQAVVAGLSKEDQNWLKQYNLRIPGFGSSMTTDKVRVSWTESEAKAAEGVFREAYAVAIAELRNDPEFKRMSTNDQQLEANKDFLRAAKDARKEVSGMLEDGTLGAKK
jgi:hypothetical protein